MPVHQHAAWLAVVLALLLILPGASGGDEADPYGLGPPPRLEEIPGSRRPSEVG